MFTMKKHDLHMEAYGEHWERSHAAFMRALKDLDEGDWAKYEADMAEYRAERKEATRHFGIAQGILTRQINAGKKRLGIAE